MAGPQTPTLTELEIAVLRDLGIGNPIERPAGGVRFVVATQESEIVFGLSRQCVLVSLTPEEARALGGNLIAAAERSERALGAARRNPPLTRWLRWLRWRCRESP